MPYAYADFDDGTLALREKSMGFGGASVENIALSVALLNGFQLAFGGTVYEPLYPYDFPAMTAEEAYDSYSETRPLSPHTGAAVKPDASVVNYTVGYSTADENHTAEALGVLTVDPATALAAIAPLSGHKVTKDLYKLGHTNQEFLEQCLEVMKPYMYEGTLAIPMCLDAATGVTYFDENLVGAVNNLLLGLDARRYNTDIPNAPVINESTRWNDQSVFYTPASDCRMVSFYGDTAGTITIASAIFASTIPGVVGQFASYLDPAAEHPVTSSASITKNGLTAYYHLTAGNVLIDTAEQYTRLNASLGYNIIAGGLTSNQVADVAWELMYGTPTYVARPEGIENRIGEIPDYKSAVNTKQIAKRVDDGVVDYTKWVPVQLPVGDALGVSTADNLPISGASSSGAIADVWAPTINPGVIDDTIGQVIPDVISTPYAGTAPLYGALSQSEALSIPAAIAATISLQPPKVPNWDDPDFMPLWWSKGKTPNIEHDFSALPSIVPSSGDGLIHVYNPTNNEFGNFGHFLWVSYANADLNKIWNNPFDGVIGALELYKAPVTQGRDNIKTGFLVSDVKADLVRQRYFQFTCGTIIVPEVLGNYLDYSPYTRVEAYLPFIGIVELDTDDIIGHAVNITYSVDAYTGACIAQITVAKEGYINTCYEFTGNCGVEIPLVGGTQAAIRAAMMGASATELAGRKAASYGIRSGIIQGGTSVVGGLFGGTMKSIAGGVLSGLGSAQSSYYSAMSGYEQAHASAYNQALSAKSTVQRSGSFGSSFGAMGIRKPYIIVRRPVQKEVYKYQNDYGFPAHSKVTIGNCSGYTRVKFCQFSSATATEAEKSAIMEALGNGIYVNVGEFNDN